MMPIRETTEHNLSICLLMYGLRNVVDLNESVFIVYDIFFIQIVLSQISILPFQSSRSKILTQLLSLLNFDEKFSLSIHICRFLSNKDFRCHLQIKYSPD